MGFLSGLLARKLTTASRQLDIEEERNALRRLREEARRAAFKAQGEALDALAQSFLDDIRRPAKKG